MTFERSHNSTPADDVAALLQRAQHLIEVQQYDRALQELNQVLAVQPDLAEAHWLAGWCLLKLHKLWDARRAAKEVIGLAPEQASGYYLLALVELAARNPRRGLLVIDEALQLETDDPDYYAVKAYLLIELRRPRQALQVAEEALALNAECTMALQARLLALSSLGWSADAQRGAVEALTRNPEDELAWYQWGVQLANDGKHAEAEHAFQQALQLDPEFEAAQGELAKVYGASHPAFALFWKIQFVFQRLPLYVQIWLAFSPVWITTEGTDYLATHPEASLPVIGGITAAWLLLGFCLFARVIIRGMIRKGWMRQRTDAADVRITQYLNAMQANQLRVSELLEAGRASLVRENHEGARQAFHTALAIAPTDREVQACFLDALQGSRRLAVWGWRITFAVLRLSAVLLMGLILVLWLLFFVGGNMALAAWGGGLAAHPVGLYALLLTVGIVSTPHLVLWRVRRRWREPLSRPC
jgi:tetratricopeptide (TPR) repeat protein